MDLPWVVHACSCQYTFGSQVRRESSNFFEWYCWWFRNPAFTSWYGKNPHSLRRVSYKSGGCLGFLPSRVEMDSRDERNLRLGRSLIMPMVESNMTWMTLRQTKISGRKWKESIDDVFRGSSLSRRVSWFFSCLYIIHIHIIHIVLVGTTPHPGCQSPPGLWTIFNRESQPKPLNCDWHPGWGGRPKVLI